MCGFAAKKFVAFVIPFLKDNEVNDKAPSKLLLVYLKTNNLVVLSGCDTSEALLSKIIFITTAFGRC